MRQKTDRHQDGAERTIKDIRRQTRKHYSSQEKIRIVLAGLRGDGNLRPIGATSGNTEVLEFALATTKKPSSLPAGLRMMPIFSFAAL